jgi:Domain of Unknown Function (DUF928)
MLNRHVFRIVFLALLGSATCLTIALPQPAIAQSFSERIQGIFSRERSEGNASGRSRGGAIRSETTQSGGLIPLVPSSSLGTTVEAYPSFWFYWSPDAIPTGDRTSEPLSAEFILLDANQMPVLEQPIAVALPETAGIIRFQVPTNQPGLEVGRQYQWIFSVVVNPDMPSDDNSVSGWVERVATDAELSQQLAVTPVSDQYMIYANHDIWQEMLTQLALHRTEHPQEWVGLLGLFHLQEMAQTPVLELQPQTDTVPPVQ